MSLIKWEPLNEVERFFDERFSPVFPKIGSDLAVDIYEENNNVIAKISLPGVKSDEIELVIEDDILTIAGKREEEKEVKNKNYYGKEIRRGSFSRSMPLPKEVDANKVVAKFEAGILIVTMPVIKSLTDKAVKIKIQ